MRWPKVLVIVLVPCAVLAGLALAVRELRGYRFADILAQAQAVPAGRLWLAALLTVASYALLTCYDRIAFVAARCRLSQARITLAAFVAQSFSLTLGHGAVVGNAVRARFYVAWGLPLPTVLRVSVYAAFATWLGIALVGGCALVCGVAPPAASLRGLPLPVLGAVLLASVAGFIACCWARREPLRLRRWTFALPTWRTACVQAVVGGADWMVGAAVLHVLLGGSVDYAPLLAVFVFAQVGGLASQAPAGIGAFEGVMLAALAQRVGADRLMGALLVFRAIYYLGPFLVAALAAGAFEIARSCRLAAVAAGACARHGHAIAGGIGVTVLLGCAASALLAGPDTAGAAALAALALLLSQRAHADRRHIPPAQDDRRQAMAPTLALLLATAATLCAVQGMRPEPRVVVAAVRGGVALPGIASALLAGVAAWLALRFR